MHLAYVYVYVCIKVREGGEALGREGARVVLVDLLADKDRRLFGLMKQTHSEPWYVVSYVCVCRVVCMYVYVVSCRIHVCVMRAKTSQRA